MKKSRSSLQQLFNVVDYLVDDHVGIIDYVKELPKESGGPDFFHFYAQACNTRAFAQQRNFGVTGGASVQRGTAMAKAIGEAVERYCSALYEPDDFSLAHYEAATFPCVPPNEFALYSNQQYAHQNFPYIPFLDSTVVRWVPATDLLTRVIRYVPAAMVFMPYSYNQMRGERPIVQPISTGLACHCTLEEAMMSAICEVIERDAFTITWQARLNRSRIRLDSLSDRNREIVDRFQRTGGEITMLNLAMDHGIPTILSVLHYSALDLPALLFAAATDIDAEEAARKSLEELAHTRRFAQLIKSKRSSDLSDPNYESVFDQDSHVNLYCDHASMELATWVFASNDQIDFQDIESPATGDLEQDLQILGKKIEAVGHRTLLIDLTSDDVRQLGLSVVRAVVPGFHPLFIGHKLRALGGERLWKVPQRLGYSGIIPASGDNPAPHPYP